MRKSPWMKEEAELNNKPDVYASRLLWLTSPIQLQASGIRFS